MFKRCIKLFKEKVSSAKTFQKDDKIRLSTYLSRAGICSRRQADEEIQLGRVIVNQKQVKELGTKVSPDDTVIYQGHKVSLDDVKETKLYIFHKGVGIDCTRKNEKADVPTIYDFLEKNGFNHLMKIGRLDRNSEGLLLLTNDGKLARSLELPETQIVRKYIVKVYGRVTQAHLDKFSRGSFINNIHYGEIKAKIRREAKKYTWINVVLKEGKNREIRKVFLQMGMFVTRLIRISYGPYKLGKIQKNQIVAVNMDSSLIKYCSNHNF